MWASILAAIIAVFQGIPKLAELLKKYLPAPTPGDDQAKIDKKVADEQNSVDHGGRPQW